MLVPLLFEEVLREFVEGFAPDLPLVVAGIGIETNLNAAVTHLLDDVAGVVDTRVLFATAHEEHIELAVERLRVRQDAWHLLLQVEV